MHIIGHSEAEDLLMKADLNRAQSFLLEGQRGIGKAGLAEKYAAHVLRNAEKIRARSHADFLVIEKRTDEKSGKEKKEIVVEDARKLREFLELTPAEGLHRVALIDSADELNTQAANAILKLVEEPPKRSIVILLSHGGHVLPTIRSRCISVKLRPLAENDMGKVLRNILPDVSEDDAEILKQIAEGSPGIAQVIYENDGLWILGELAEIIANYPNTNYQQLTKFAERVEKADNGWQVFCHIFEWAVSRTARDFAAGKPVRLGHAEILKPVNIAYLLDRMERWNELRRETEVFNLDKKQTIAQTLDGFAKIIA